MTKLLERLLGRGTSNKVDLANLRSVCALWVQGRFDGFQVVSGHVLKADNYKNKKILQLADEDGFCWQEFQKLNNHTHISHLLELGFTNHNYESDDYEFVADLYEALLRYRLKKDFPNEQFVVERYLEEDGDITITFYQ